MVYPKWLRKAINITNSLEDRKALYIADLLLLRKMAIRLGVPTKEIDSIIKFQIK